MGRVVLMMCRALDYGLPGSRYQGQGTDALELGWPCQCPRLRLVSVGPRRGKAPAPFVQLSSSGVGPQTGQSERGVPRRACTPRHGPGPGAPRHS
ncbi:hypothetical protein AAFF_G00428610 [Aldrovandia affinis]|uniref:Uncharacterized protein n=1 Tax=Aldrovandia affinis TaxID=143900 RepID=A0AAD7WII5_9TELE|nr:hypothetical protein AAFF_G00428610 [Aldrovandia affinis]